MFSTPWRPRRGLVLARYAPETSGLQVQEGGDLSNYSMIENRLQRPVIGRQQLFISYCNMAPNGYRLFWPLAGVCGRRGGFTCVKEAVLPFQRFPGVDIILGPEMHSTGEVMGMGSDFPEAYYKSQLASGQDLPQGGNVFISVNDRDKPILPEVAAMFADLGFHLLATRGTARYLREHGLEVEEVLKVYEGRPNIVDRMINGDVALVINTASGKNTARDSKSIRHTAVSYGVPYCTTVAGAKASAIAIGKRREDTHVESLQEYYAREARG